MLLLCGPGGKTVLTRLPQIPVVTSRPSSPRRYGASGFGFQPASTKSGRL
jgi:hypothetical protein